MAAMREGSLGSSKAKRRWVLGPRRSRSPRSASSLMLVGLFGGLDTSPALTLLGIGAVLVFVGVGLLSPLLVGPLAALIGRPLAATGGVAAQIARGNAVRAPGRTAGTAAALMVGVALVAFVAIFVNGFKASFSGAFEKAVTADFVVLDPSGLTPEAVAPAAARLASVGAAANIRVGKGKLAVGDRRQPRRPRPEARERGPEDRLGRRVRRRAAGARPADAMLEVDFAKEHSLRVGSSFVLRNPERQPVRLTVRGTYEDRGQLFGDVLVPDATLRDRFGAHTVLAALIASAPGHSEDQVRAELAGLLDRDFPTLEPQTRRSSSTRRSARSARSSTSSTRCSRCR